MPSTIVTMFFNIKKLTDTSKELRPLEFYLEKAKGTLSLNYPMVVFCDKDTKPLLAEIRGDLPTKYVERDIVEYDFFTTMWPVIIENRRRVPSPDPRNTASYFLIMMFKYVALFLAKQNNYYPETTHYVWLDLGAAHVVKGVPENVPAILENPKDKITCCYIHYRGKDELYPMTNYLARGGKTGVAGGFLTVESSYIERLYCKVLSIFYEQLSLGVGHSDEQVITYCYDQRPDWFNLYFGDYYSLVNNYHKSVEDHHSIKTYFIPNASINGKHDLVDLALKSMQ